MLQSHTTHLIWDYTVFNNGASRCAREHGTDTQHPELLPAFPSGFVIASAARSAYIMSWDKVMSLAGFTFHHYHLGICVPDPSVLPAVGAQSKETAGPAQGVSKLHAIQKGCSLFRFVLAEEERQLYLSSFTWTIIVFVVCELLITCLHKNGCFHQPVGLFVFFFKGPQSNFDSDRGWWIANSLISELSVYFRCMLELGWSSNYMEQLKDSWTKLFWWWFNGTEVIAAQCSGVHRLLWTTSVPSFPNVKIV